MLKRLAISTLLLLISSFIVFAGVRGTVDPTDKLRTGSRSAESIQKYKESRGLDKPIVTQYKNWITNAVVGDFGVSDVDRQPVSEKLTKAFSKTFELMFFGIIISIFFGLFLGIIAAIRRNTFTDFSLQVFSSLGIAIPVFFFAYLLIELFTVQMPKLFGLSEPLFYIDGNADGFLGQTETGLWTLTSIKEYMKHLTLPVLVLSIQLIASWMRYQRSSMVEALNSDYVRTAKAKGMKNSRIYMRHAFRNSQIPMINVIALDIGALFGGLIITEVIFGIDGMGKTFVDALDAGDAPTLVAWSVFTAFAIIVFNLLADLLLPVIDPRVRAKI